MFWIRASYSSSLDWISSQICFHSRVFLFLVSLARNIINFFRSSHRFYSSFSNFETVDRVERFDFKICIVSSIRLFLTWRSRGVSMLKLGVELTSINQALRFLSSMTSNPRI